MTIGTQDNSPMLRSIDAAIVDYRYSLRRDELAVIRRNIETALVVLHSMETPAALETLVGLWARAVRVMRIDTKVVA